ncbi:ergothioneine biosynthesis glutamate--cysteine ligase EgtA [Glycomyces sp. L485]|uniref:ergothioneine biosynthesis glutamate--cysteine ligase EgtA n=1 Tax=Glycomyces sp. L485 TaxID=2909235 RepID=UPI001F4A3DD4|nr:ergothioneine biosynthesis glutamate--cysteine ligase EgtA [Glycomyces sp. L485]MCH7232127.1 ergothioneine biosynthesis glutamate--cysteine ligase EgtA [Glycomyces sp. L485]
MSGKLTEAEAETYLIERCFTVHRPRRIGVELEWLVRRAGDRAAPVSRELSRSAVAPLEAASPLRGGGLVTREPGGQIELSSRPADSLGALLADVETDLAVLAGALAARGLVIDGNGLDSCRESHRVLDDRRYRAMEAYFSDQPSGRTVMCSTASVQVNLDAGTEHGIFGHRRRWHLAHRLGPVLVASFANSPLRDGRPTGWKSTRQALWFQIDPGRTFPVPDEHDVRAAWARYALDARLLCLKRDAADHWNAPPGLTFRAWLRGEGGERHPTVDDLDYHLGTLFPPVRPRGWLELRMIDAQNGDDWIVPVALCAALFDHPGATVTAWEATEPLAAGRLHPPWETWRLAAREGLDAPAVREAAQACFTAAESALARSGAPAKAQTSLRDFASRYIDRGRTPADDQLPTHQEFSS